MEFAKYIHFFTTFSRKSYEPDIIAIVTSYIFITTVAISSDVFSKYRRYQWINIISSLLQVFFQVKHMLLLSNTRFPFKSLCLTVLWAAWSRSHVRNGRSDLSESIQVQQVCKWVTYVPFTEIYIITYMGHNYTTLSSLSSLVPWWLWLKLKADNFIFFDVHDYIATKSNQSKLQSDSKASCTILDSPFFVFIYVTIFVFIPIAI